MILRSARPLLALSPLAAAIGLLACSPNAVSDGGPGRAAGSADDDTVAARVAEDEITVGELDEWIKEELFRRQTNDREPAKLHELRAEALQNMVSQRLLEAEASARGVTPEELVQAETRSIEVSDEDVRAFYDRHAAQLGGASFEQAEPRIRQHLSQQAMSQSANALLRSLRQEHDVEILLEAPRVEVAAEGPARGPEDAPVTIVEFSDYECPYCRRIEPTLAQIVERYPEQVRLVYRHFPIDSIHPRARAAAEAATCAHRQDRFWEYHEILFSNEDYGDEALRGYAEQAGLDLEAWETCREDPATKRAVQEDVDAGRAVGVTGTPAFFVNGRPLRGAVPLENFVQVIESELRAAAGDGGEVEAGGEDA